MLTLMNAKMNFVGDVAAAEEAMQPVRGSMSALINLDVLPSLNLEEAAKDLDSQEVANALAGNKHVWWHHDSDDDCTPLPQRVNASMEFAVMEYVKEHQKWQAQIAARAARGGKGLTAAAKARPEAWKGNPLLDPARKATLSKGTDPQQAPRLSASDCPWTLIRVAARSLSVSTWMERNFLGPQNWTRAFCIPPSSMRMMHLRKRKASWEEWMRKRCSR